MCLLCSDSIEDRALAKRAHVLQLLALVEHPDALPAEAALRLGHEIMALIQLESGVWQCEAVTAPVLHVEETR
jgi:hypothetical protein